MEYYKMVEQGLVPYQLEFLSVRRTYRFSNLTSTIFDTTINTKCTYVRNLKPWILTVPCRGALGLPICRNGGPWGCTPGPSPQIVAGQLTLYEPGRADSAHHITTWPTQILRPTTIHECYRSIWFQNIRLKPGTNGTNANAISVNSKKAVLA